MGRRHLVARDVLRRRACAGAVAALLFPALLSAGQIYGSVVMGNAGLASATIEVDCGGAATRGATAADGSYRIKLPQQGQCALTLPDFAGRPSAVIFSNPNPSAYNFELVKRSDGRFELRETVSMAVDPTDRDPAQAPRTPGVAYASATVFPWMDLLKVVALPLVTLFLGYKFNASISERQASDNNMRLYTEMMANREKADSDLRKDMFKSILDTFMSKDPKLDQPRQLRQEVLNLELLAYNFHESLDIGPLFKDVRSRIPDHEPGANADLRNRLEKVGQEVIERQLTALSDSGTVERGDASPGKIDQLQAYLFFGSHTVPDPSVTPGEGVPRLCLSMDESAETAAASTESERHHRQFKLEIIRYDPIAREVQVRLYVSQLLSQAECQQANLDLAGRREIDTNFWVGLFDFPLIDNTRLTHDERCSVSLIALTPNVLNLALVYFPGSRASLKDKPFYDEMMHDLVGHHAAAGQSKH